MAEFPIWVMLVSSMICGSIHMTMANLGMYDPDGAGPLHSYVGEIVEEGPGGPLLVVHHNLEERSHVSGGNEAHGVLGFPITYVHDGHNIPIESVKAAVDKALSCEYFLTWECHHAVLTNYSWWIDFNSLRVDWSQSQGTFCIADDGSRMCSCDANDFMLRVEEGTLTNYERFPMRELRVGDVSGPLEYAFITISPLKCQMPNNACEPPSNPAFGLVTGINYTYGHGIAYGHQIAYQCASGYSMHGDPTAVCQPNGEWSAMAPTCQLIECPTLEPPLRGVIIGDSTIIGSDVTYACEAGFQLEATTSCTADGWETMILHCEAVNCSDPGEPQNGNRIGDDFAHLSVVEFNCRDGYNLVGANTITCQEPGLWSADAPTCQLNFPYVCGFETEDICGFEQPTTDQFDWSRSYEDTFSIGTGPMQAYDGYYYMYIEASHPRVPGDYATLETPVVAQTGPACIEFYYHMMGSEIGALIITTASRSVDNYLMRYVGDHGEQWVLGQVDVNLGLNDRVLFIGQRGTGAQGDIAIDSVRLYQGEC